MIIMSWLSWSTLMTPCSRWLEPSSHRLRLRLKLSSFDLFNTVENLILTIADALFWTFNQNLTFVIVIRMVRSKLATCLAIMFIVILWLFFSRWLRLKVKHLNTWLVSFTDLAQVVQWFIHVKEGVLLLACSFFFLPAMLRHKFRLIRFRVLFFLRYI